MSTTSLDRGRMIPIHPGRRAASDADRGPRPLAAAAVVVLLAGAFLSLGCRPGAAPDFAAAPPELVELAVAAPDIILDIKYATTDNLTGKAVYPIARCFLVKEAAQALVQVQADLRTFGYGLKVFDGYRPLSVQKIFWSILPDERFVADPAKGSRHNRGYAVDLTLVDAAGREVLMPTPFDDFTERAARDFMDLPREAIAHRALLELAMTNRGFIPYAPEWWHFDFRGFEDKPVLDVPLDKMN